jgi:hypothetical protein
MRTLPLLAIVAALTLAGCETYYKKPESGATAKVRFAGSSPRETIMVTQYESARCDLGASGGIMGVVGGINRDPLGNVPAHVKAAGNTEGMIGYDERSGSRPIERVITADRDFVFSTFRVIDARADAFYIRTKTCSLSLQLTPRAGEQYEVLYSEAESGCHAAAFRLAPAPGGAVQRIPEPSFRNTPVKCSGTGAVK